MAALPGQIGEPGGNSKNVVSEQPRSFAPGVLPVGLDELDRTDRIIVQQMAGMTDACCSYEAENQYDISDRFDHVILQATEQSNCCSRQCCHRLRSFNLSMADRRGEVVSTVERPLRCDNCLCCPTQNQVSFKRDYAAVITS